MWNCFPLSGKKTLVSFGLSLWTNLYSRVLLAMVEAPFVAATGVVYVH
jgi:hypothetical protein